MTYIPTYLDVSNLKSEKLIRLLQLWNNFKFDLAGQISSQNDAFGRMRDDLIVVDLKPDQKKYLFEHFGKSVRQHFGTDVTGKYLEDFNEGTLKILLKKALDDICKTKLPYCGKRNDLIDFLLLRYEVLILPVVRSVSAEISKILIAFDFNTKEANQFRSVNSQFFDDSTVIKSPVLKVLFDTYRASASEFDMPHVEAFSWQTLAAQNRDIVQLSVTTMPLRFMVDFAGERIKSMLGYDPTHTAVDELDDVELGKLYHLSFQAVLFKKQKLWMQFQRPVGRDWADIEIIMLPVRNDANEISRIISGAVFSKKESLSGN